MHGGRPMRADEDRVKAREGSSVVLPQAQHERTSERPGETGPGNGLAHDSFGAFLAELHSLFPAALVGGSGWDRLLALAHRLPLHVIDNRFGFEFDLCDPDPAADFCVVPVPGAQLAEFYSAQGELAPSESPEAALGAFLAEQARDPQALLRGGEGGVILEYDLVGISSAQPASPGIFIVPRDVRDESCREKLFGEPERLATALWAVAGWTPDEAILWQIQRTYRLMPPIATVSQAGILPGRTQRAVRLILGTKSSEDAVDLLARLGWSGSAADVTDVCESLAELTRQSVSLSVDVTAQGISPRLGLEFHRPAEWHELDHSGWNRLIDRLEENGWCLPEKARGLKAWPRVEQVFDATGVYRVQQSINHVKVVVDRGATAAKAYAGTIVLQAA